MHAERFVVLAQMPRAPQKWLQLIAKPLYVFKVIVPVVINCVYNFGLRNVCQKFNQSCDAVRTPW